VADAHAAGLVVHPYTFRIENYFLPLECRLGDPAAPDFLRMHGDFQRELLAFLDLGIDGFFSDNSKEAVLVRDYFSARGPLKRA
jgi:glycerophosphoryl diester phosphodiesterase